MSEPDEAEGPDNSPEGLVGQARERLPETMGVVQACQVIGISTTTYYRRVHAEEWPHWGGYAAIPREWVLQTAGVNGCLRWLQDEATRESLPEPPLGKDGLSRLEDLEARCARLEEENKAIVAEQRKIGETLMTVMMRVVKIT